MIQRFLPRILIKARILDKLNEAYKSMKDLNVALGEQIEYTLNQLPTLKTLTYLLIAISIILATALLIQSKKKKVK